MTEEKLTAAILLIIDRLERIEDKLVGPKEARETISCNHCKGIRNVGSIHDCRGHLEYELAKLDKKDAEFRKRSELSTLAKLKAKYER